MKRRLALEELDSRLVPSVYYVAPGGSNSNAGTSASPWGTLQHAANTLQAGDQVIVRAGNYAGFNQSRDGTAASPIRFTAESGVTINSPNPSGPHAGQDGINIEGGDYIIVEGFKVVNMPRAGIRVVTNTGVVVRNNNCDNNGRWGILTGFAENVTIENNVTSRSQAEHGIYVSNSADNPIVRGNTSFSNRGCGIHMNSDASAGGDGVITGALIENNIIYDNGVGGGSAINMDGVSNSIVRNNVLYNNHATGIALYRIDGTHGAWNNVIVNNTVRVAADGRWALLINNGSTGNTVFNNILLNDGTYRGSMSVSQDSLSGLKSNYNVVMDRFTTDDGNTRLTLAQWQATGRDLNSIIATPALLFVNPSGNDYHLLATSPAKDLGTASFNNASAPSSDRDGVTRPSGPSHDIGSYELNQGPVEPPSANNDSYAVVHDRTLTAPPAGVLANDDSPYGRPLTASLVTAPAHGTLTLNTDGSFTYRPAAGYVGGDSFTYVARDGSLSSDPATVSISVTNQTPVALDDAYKIGMNRQLSVASPGVLANDTDADGDARTASLVSGPSHGTLTLNANGSFTYTPATGYSGPDSFVYRTTDTAGASDTATVDLTVLPRPKVKSVVFNDGSNQRSLIRSITVTFDTVVTFDAGAFRLVRGSGSVPTKTLQISEVNGETKVVMTFTGSGTAYGSLNDGNWTLKILRGRVHRADDPLTTMSADYIQKFHRFFGDSDGDRDTDATDQTAFNNALGQTDAASLATFDYDNDGDVDAADQTQFNRRFGRRI
jgi:parallel beta-helix repeat protein